MPELFIIADGTGVPAGCCDGEVVPPAGVVRPAGEWNESRVIARGNQIEHWLNGQRVVDIEIASPRWNQLLAASKFNSMTGFGVQTEGFIALQDHGDVVQFRNVQLSHAGGGDVSAPSPWMRTPRPVPRTLSTRRSNAVGARSWSAGSSSG